MKVSVRRRKKLYAVIYNSSWTCKKIGVYYSFGKAWNKIEEDFNREKAVHGDKFDCCSYGIDSMTLWIKQGDSKMNYNWYILGI